MKQFGKILKFELKSYLTNKVFVGITLFLVLAIAAVMFFPRVTEALKTESPAVEESEVKNRPVMLLKAEDPMAEDAFQTAFPEYDVRMAEGSVEDAILSGQAECAFVLEGLTAYTYYVDNLSMYDMNTEVADELLRGLYQTGTLMEMGVAAENVRAILGIQIGHETVRLGKDQMSNFFYTYIMIFALYMVILLYGQMVATNVATEKSSRAMELLITSARPVSMMFGKVVASCLAGLIQLIAVFGSSLLCFRLNQEYWGGNMIVESIFNMPVDLFVYMLVFFVLGFFIYAFMFGAIGSMASKLEDINTLVMPVTFLFIAGFIVVMMGMASGEVETGLMKACSFIPFTSPMAMFTRLAMTTVPGYEVAVSIAVLVVSAAAIGVMAARIYRVGVLLYGAAPNVKTILRAMKKA